MKKIYSVIILLLLIAILLAIYFYLSYRSNNKSSNSKVETLENMVETDVSDVIESSNLYDTNNIYQPEELYDLEKLNMEIALEDGMDIYDYLDNDVDTSNTNIVQTYTSSEPTTDSQTLSESTSMLPIQAPTSTVSYTSSILPRCYNLLVRRNNLYYLYSTSVPESDDGTNPKVFNSIDEYKNFQDAIKNQGFQCPDLKPQEESNVLEVSGLPPMVINPRLEDIDTSALSVPSKTFQNMKYNKEQQVEKTPLNDKQYTAFDKQNRFIGNFTMVESDNQPPMNQRPPPYTENAMDSNWGGYLFTQQALNTEDSQVNRRMVPIDMISMSPTLVNQT
jgi:hypothetical protein